MTEEQKVEVLKAQLDRIRHNESDPVKKLEREIVKLGYVPDRSTWRR